MNVICLGGVSRNIVLSPRLQSPPLGRGILTSAAQDRKNKILHLTEGAFSPARSRPGASSLRPRTPTKKCKLHGRTCPGLKEAATKAGKEPSPERLFRSA